MRTFHQFWKQPQRVWLRKALFQVHLWTGIGTGLYVFLVSISGSAIVFRNEIYKANDSPVIIVEGIGERMTTEKIEEAAKRVYPGYQVTQVYEFPDNPKRAVEVRLEKGRSLHNRLIDPYTGADLGPSVPWQIRVMAWFEDLHINLFGGKTGRQINAAGGVLWSLLALTGIVVWWPGIQNWKRSLGVRFKSGWKRFNWDLHSSFGFWTFLLTLMWGVTGVFAAIPDPFRAAVDYLEPLQRIEYPDNPGPRGQRGIAQREQETAPAGQLNTTVNTTGQSAPEAQQGSRGQRGQRGGRGRRPLFKPRVGD